jgi:hypothetical protein
VASFFLAGIIQGSIPDAEIHPQDYRVRIKAAIERAFPGADIYCPVEDHPASLGYGPGESRRVFFDLMACAGRSDVLIAYVPEASMGTAVEMWEAHRRGRVVVAVSPLARNWVIRFLADAVVCDLVAFEEFVEDGRLAALIEEKRAT